MKLVAVTGANGMIGSRVIEQLVRAGVRFRVLLRQDKPMPKSAEVVIGDLRSEESLHRLLDGVNTIFHCSGELHDASVMHAVNVTATERLAEIAIELGVTSFIHISSAGVIGPTDREWIDEASPCHPFNLYEQSKWQAERVLSGFSDQLRVCMLRPLNVVDDERPGVVAMASRDVWRDRLAVLVKGAERAHIVHAVDVAAAALFLAENQYCSGAYFVGYDEHEDNTIVSIFNMARRELAKREYHGLVLAATVPYWLRRLKDGKSLHGKTRFSSKKLTEAGFKFPLGFERAVERCCAYQGHIG